MRLSATGWPIRSSHIEWFPQPVTLILNETATHALVEVAAPGPVA